MAILYPTALDTFTNPTEHDNTNSATVPHWDQHADANDAIEALQAKVGIDGSADTDSLDYKIARRPYLLTFVSNPAGFSPADSTTYYAGILSAEAATTYDNVSIIVPLSGTLVRVDLKVRVRGTLGTTEDVTHNLRLNDATDFATIALDYDAAFKESSSTGLSQAVVAGDKLALKIVTPAWATNPTDVHITLSALIES